LGGGCLLRKAVHQERGPFIKGGGRLFVKGGGRPFIKGGGRLFVEGRRRLFGGWRPFVEGRRRHTGEDCSSGGGHSSGGGCLLREEGGGHSSRQGGIFVERRGCLSLWWEERTMNFCIGKFKIQHGCMMSEFEQTS